MVSTSWRNGILLASISLVLSACGPAEVTTTPNAQSPDTAPAQVVRNAAPSIGGTPETTAAVGTTYLFQAIAADANGDELIFSASGLPAWAAIDAGTGLIYGTPSSGSAGVTAAIVVSVSDGKASVALPAFQITVTEGLALAPPPGNNAAPVIFGSPAAVVQSSASYSFVPEAVDTDGHTLAFSISGKPAWATFSTATGALTGSPAPGEAGTYAGIVIAVSDGAATQILPAFSITVTRPVTTNGTAALSWTAPTQNTDGTPLTDLMGYRVYHGTSAGSLSEMIELPGVGSTSYDFSQLHSGTHYFAVTAYTSSGIESALSGIGAKTIL